MTLPLEPSLEFFMAKQSKRRHNVHAKAQKSARSLLQASCISLSLLAFYFRAVVSERMIV
eukprot:scaffold41771_cov32-Tisochrysis_lutea.AAC.5